MAASIRKANLTFKLPVVCIDFGINFPHKSAKSRVKRFWFIIFSVFKMKLKIFSAAFSCATYLCGVWGAGKMPNIILYEP